MARTSIVNGTSAIKSTNNHAPRFTVIDGGVNHETSAYSMRDYITFDDDRFFESPILGFGIEKGILKPVVIAALFTAATLIILSLPALF